MIHSELRAKQVILLAGLLLVEGKVPPATIAFLARSYLDFSDIDEYPDGLSAAHMGKNYMCTKQAALKHVAELERNDILVRARYRKWKFNWDVLSRLNDLDKIDI